ncbi:MAG: purine-nucleoside phosphorylase [Deltaproteobacteria bacterium]|nr:MAG: purine-nucleoside phosphorylase [Deltaproteobacteria bacterium]
MRRQLGQVSESVAYLKKKTEIQPQIGIVLGTGLGGLADRIQAASIVPYEEIPHFPISTVTSHAGRLIFGSLGGKNVMAKQGRFHYYEGYEAKEITFSIRIMAAMGVQTLIISNAAGGLNPEFEAGDLVLIRDHINLTGQNPLRGDNVDEWGPRFPDMTEPYSHALIGLAEKTARALDIKVHQGVYVGVTGPSMETAAETRFLRFIGADIVGMSTISEVIVALHSGMSVLGISVVTNVNDPDDYQPAPIEQVIATAERAGPKLVSLVEEILKRM